MGKYDSVFEQLSRMNCVRKPRFACILIFYVYNLFFQMLQSQSLQELFIKQKQNLLELSI